MPSSKNGAPGFEFSTSVVCGLRFMMSQPFDSPALFSGSCPYFFHLTG